MLPRRLPHLDGYQILVNELLWGLTPPDLQAAEAAAAGEGDPHPPIVPPRTEAELKQFVLDTFGVVIPDVQVCPHHATPWQAFKTAFFAEAPVCVWKASRGFGGKSFLLSLLGLTEAIALRADVAVLGGSGEQSERILESMDKLWKAPAAPRHVLESDPAKTETRFIHGNKITAQTASQKSVRGPHPQRLRCDEVDEMALPILKSALGQPMDKGWVKAQVVESSTHQYPDKTMTWAIKEAAEKGMPVFEWCWRESHAHGTGWLTQDEIDRKRIIMPAEQWRVEVDLQEPNPEGRAINQDAVARMFGPDRMARAWGSAGELPEGFDPSGVWFWVFEPFDPDPNAKYAHGTDWGKKLHWSSTFTYRYDCNPARLVAFQRRQREPWPILVEKAEAQVKLYPGSWHYDGTGLGTVIADLTKISCTPVTMVGRERADLLSNYIKAIERDELLAGKHKCLDAAKAEHQYASVKDIYESKEGHLPDTIAAGALCNKAISSPPAAGATRDPDDPATRHVANPPSRPGNRPNMGSVFPRRSRS